LSLFLKKEHFTCNILFITFLFRFTSPLANHLLCISPWLRQ